MRGDGGGGSAARTSQLFVNEKKKEIRPLTWGADCARERSNHRLRAFLREFGARLCYWGQPRPPSTLLWFCVPTRFNPSSLSSFCLRSPLLLTPSLFLTPIPYCSTSPHHLHPHQNDERDNPSLFSFQPHVSFPFFSHNIVLHLFLFLSLSPFLQD